MNWANKLGFGRVPGPVRGIFLITLTVNIGNYMTPFMSVFLTANLGIRSQLSGIFVSLAGMAFLPGSLLGGKLADIWGKKQVFVLFQLLAAAVTVINAFVLDKNWSPWLFILNAMFVAATIPVYNATIFAAASEDNLNESLSLFFVGMNVGNLFSGLIGAAFFSRYVTLIFCFEGLIKLLSVILFLKCVDDRPAESEQPACGLKDSDSDSETPVKGGLVGQLIKNPVLLLFSVSCMLFSIVLSQNNYSLPLHLNSVFGAAKGTTYYGIILGVNSLTIVTLTGTVSRLTAGRKKTDMVLLACGLLGTGFGMLYFGRVLWVNIVSTVLWSLADILNTPNSSAYFAEYAPASMFGRFAAWIKIVTGAGYAIGPICMGFIMEQYGMRVIWPVLAYLACFSAAILCMVKILEKKKKQGSAT